MQYTTAQLERVANIAALLHLFTHRNINQHRRSLWWRHFQQFRSAVRRLHSDLATLLSEPTTNFERAKAKAAAPGIKAAITAYTAGWPVHRWHRAFTQLVADGRFAHLGLVLVASSAEICAVTDIIAKLDDLGDIEVQRVLHDFAEDLGSTVSRDDLTISETTIASLTSEASSRAATPASSLTKSRITTIKPKKKRKNAIDDLFSGL